VCCRVLYHSVGCIRENSSVLPRLLQVLQVWCCAQMALNEHLPDDLWMHIVSYICKPPTREHLTTGEFTLATGSAVADLALVCRQLRNATRILCKMKRSIRAFNSDKAVSTVDAHAVLLAVARRGHSYRSADWRARFVSFANIVKLDLSRLTDDQTAVALSAASEVCRHIKALALPGQYDRNDWYLPGQGRNAVRSALHGWRQTNGGLRYLSLGYLVNDDVREAGWMVELIGQACPHIEFLNLRGNTELGHRDPTVWAGFWRACHRLRQSNWAFPVRTQVDFRQFTAEPKPQLTYLCLDGYNFGWVADDPNAMAQFVATLPSLQSLRLQVRPGRRVQLDSLICHALVQCPVLESITIVATRLPCLRQMSGDVTLLTPRGLLALIRCLHVQRIRIERVAIDAACLVEIVPASSSRLRLVDLQAVHFDRDVLVAFLESLIQLPHQALANCRLRMHVVNKNDRVSRHNRACDELQIRALVDAIARQHARDVVCVRVDLMTPCATFVGDRSGFIVTSIALAINAAATGPLARPHRDGVFVDGVPVVP
jgi:hypothetical protein